MKSSLIKYIVPHPLSIPLTLLLYHSSLLTSCVLFQSQSTSCYQGVHGCRAAPLDYKQPIGVSSLRKTDSCYPSSHLLSTDPQLGAGFVSPSFTQAGIWTGFILFGSCASGGWQTLWIHVYNEWPTLLCLENTSTHLYGRQEMQEVTRKLGKLQLFSKANQIRSTEQEMLKSKHRATTKSQNRHTPTLDTAQIKHREGLAVGWVFPGGFPRSRIINTKVRKAFKQWPWWLHRSSPGAAQPRSPLSSLTFIALWAATGSLVLWRNSAICLKRI